MSTESGLVPVTVVSTFVPLPGMVDPLVAAMLTNSTEILARQEGFLGHQILRTADAGQIVNLAVWRDDAALQAMRQNPAAQGAMVQQRTFAKSVTVQVLHPIDTGSADPR